MTPIHAATTPSARRGSALVAVIVALIVLQLIIVGMVLTGSRDHNLTVRRLETVRAFYAAEGGMNMALREVMLDIDCDADGAIGSVSSDGNSVNDPAISLAAVSVAMSITGSDTTLTSRGRAGSSRRQLQATLN